MPQPTALSPFPGHRSGRRNPGRAQQTLLVEMKLRVKRDEDRVYRTECWRRKGCIDRRLWRYVVGTPQVIIKVPISDYM